MGYIYMLTNKINGKRYIGQTQQENIFKRWNVYKNLQKSSIGGYLYKALLKWKPENFKFQIICICFNSKCNEYEVDYIQKYNTLAPNGYNLQSGGENYKPHPSTVEKIRQSLTGRVGYSGEKSAKFGKPISDEQKKKLSASLKKFAEQNKGKPRTQGTKPLQRTIEQYDKDNIFVAKYDSLTAAAKSINTTYSVILRYAKAGILYRNYYWKITSEIADTSKIPHGLRLGQEALKKKVNQYDLHGNFIASYESLSEAARSIGGTTPYIGKCASNEEKHKRYKTYKGFTWKFSEQTQ